MQAMTSVIIASHNAETVIVECLKRLLRQGNSRELEIILADSSDDRTPELVETLFPSVQLLHFSEPYTLPELRGKGIAQAKGIIIAILDPFSMVADDWLQKLTEVHSKQPHQIIGGTVDLFEAQQHGALTWAQFIHEYGMFMTPASEGEIEILPGSNISYKRAALFEGDRPRFSVFWKTFANTDITKMGEALWLAPSVHVALWKPIGFTNYFLTRFSHGRCYAGMRCETSTFMTRFGRIVSAPIVPFVLQYRWGRRIWPKGRYRGIFLLTLPLQFSLFSCWAFGELAGYLAGPGNCCKKLYY
jgi:glycosyltransferase involved in cell wall biosynthesis